MVSSVTLRDRGCLESQQHSAGIVSCARRLRSGTAYSHAPPDRPALAQPMLRHGLMT